MKLPWLQPRTATLAELADQLERARESDTAARAATVAAERTFDDDGSPSAEKALHAARDAERSASEHLARAERLHAAALEAKAAAERHATERRAAEIEAQIEDRSEDNRLVAREVEAWRTVIAAREVRREHELARSELRHQLRQAEASLGRPRPYAGHFESNDPPQHPVAEALRGDATGKDGSEPRIRFVHSIIHFLESR